MMKLLKTLIVLISLVSFNSKAQDVSNIKTFVQQKAGPHESLQEFYESFVEEFKALKLPSNQNQLKLVVKFVIEKDGSFSNITVIDQSEEVVNEIVRVLSKMPRWKPGYQDGQPVRSSFNLPITIKLNNYDENEDNFKRDVAAYREVLKKYEQEMDYFKFNCNCVTLTAVIEPDGSSELFQYETIDKVGLYNIGIKKFSEVNEKKFFKDLIKEISKSESKYKKVKLGNTDALDVQWFEVWQENTIYNRTIFFFEKNVLYTLNFASNSTEITNIVFEELLQSFQVKQ